MTHPVHVPHTVQWSLPWALGKKAKRPASYDAVISWTPPASPAARTTRKPLNLALVIDRSGSMDDSLDGGLPSSFHRLIQRATPSVQPAPVTPTPWVQPSPTPWPQPFPGSPNPWESPVWLAQNGPVAMSLGVDKAAALDHLDAYRAVDVPTVEAPKSKLDLTLEAAWAAIQTLGAQDRVSIVSFDNQAKVVCAGVAGTDRKTLRRALDSIVTGGSTALFDGWALGARTVAEAMSPEHQNRVLLLTDGQANVGERSPDRIASRLAELAETGIATTTFGVGKDYNEDLLQAMAQSGDGNYYYLRGTDDFLTLFEDEFNGLARVMGRKVRAKVDAEGWAEAPDLLNEFPVDAQGWSRLPNLMHAQPLTMALRMKPGQAPGQLKVRLRFEGVDGVEHEQVLDLVQPTAKTVGAPDQGVVDRVAGLLVAREKKKAVAALDRGDLLQATTTLRNATGFLSGASEAMACASTQTLNMLATGMEEGDQVTMRKTALYQTYNERAGKAR